MSNVKITQTETEYILKISYYEKDRAKTIKGYRWDNDNKSWVYPRTLRNYEALIAEFGDDLVSLEITPPEIKLSSVQLEKPHEKEGEQKEDFSIIRKQLEALLENKKLSEAELSKMINELSLAKDEATRALIEKDQEISNLKQYQEKLEQELQRLRNITITQDFSHQIKEILKRSTGGDKDFCAFADDIKIDRTAVFQTTIFLEETLRRLLGEKNKSLSLHDLLMRAKDADLLSQEAINLAHIIRSQRNILAHEKVDIRTHQARILCLFAIWCG